MTCSFCSAGPVLVVGTAKMLLAPDDTKRKRHVLVVSVNHYEAGYGNQERSVIFQQLVGSALFVVQRLDFSRFRLQVNVSGSGEQPHPHVHVRSP